MLQFLGWYIKRINSQLDSTSNFLPQSLAPFVIPEAMLLMLSTNYFVYKCIRSDAFCNLLNMCVENMGWFLHDVFGKTARIGVAWLILEKAFTCVFQFELQGKAMAETTEMHPKNQKNNISILFCDRLLKGARAPELSANILEL